MHWPIDASALRPLLPDGVEIDEFDGTAWIGVVPFTMWGIRKARMPAIPGLSAFHELNVRTYVHRDGVPGVWFFSLDAPKRIPVKVARAAFSLPYYLSQLSLKRNGDTIDYSSKRIHRGAPEATFNARWTIGDPLPEAQPDSLEFFLTERYCLYAQSRRGIVRAQIWHKPWPLQNATLHSYSSTMIQAIGAPEPQTQPVVHYADELHVNIWSPRLVAGVNGATR